MVTILNTFKRQQCCISKGGVEHTDESYADDICLITEILDEMNTILERLCAFPVQFGLTMNIEEKSIVCRHVCVEHKMHNQ